MSKSREIVDWVDNLRGSALTLKQALDDLYVNGDGRICAADNIMLVFRKITEIRDIIGCCEETLEDLLREVENCDTES